MAASLPAMGKDVAMSTGPPTSASLDNDTAKKLEKNFLTCSVCFEVYTKPKCLPCLHTFCSHCLLSYIKSQDIFGIRGKMGFPCPMCKQLATVRNNHKPYEEWLDEMPNNFLIQNMIDCLNLDTDVQDEVEIDDEASAENEADESTPLQPTAPQDDPRQSVALRPTAPSLGREGDLPRVPSRPNSISGDTQFSFLTRMLSVENAMSQHNAFSNLQDSKLQAGLRVAQERFFRPATVSQDRVDIESLIPRNPVISSTSSNSWYQTYNMTAKNWADYKPPKISDVICLPKRNSIIVLDWANRCVKYVKDFFLNRNVCTAMEVVGRPCSVALLDKEHEDRIVLSLLNRNRIYFIRVPELQLIDVMETNRTYRGISVISPSCFIAASPGAPSVLDIISISPQCKMIASRRVSMNTQSPLYMSVISYKCFIVSDNDRNNLNFFEVSPQTGHNIAERRMTILKSGMARFQSIGGICYHNNCVYVVDSVRNEVQKVTLGGHEIGCEVFLTASQGVYKPASVCVGPLGEIVVVNWEGRVTMYKNM